MVSTRKFLSILSMMLIILFLFQIFQVAKQHNRYEENDYIPETSVFAKERSEENGLVRFAQGEKIILCGDLESELGRMVKQWCELSKKNLYVSDLEAVLELEEAEQPALLLVDSEWIHANSNASKLIKAAQKGISIVFCNLPEPSVISTNPALAEILGVSKVRQDKVALEGLYLFDGFLLGGEVVYRQSEKNGKEYQDFLLEAPWYELGAGTKTYMVGMLDEKQYERNEFPSLIWRHAYRNAMVFAVNGDYLTKLSAPGILESMLYETRDYLLYPVVNAHVMPVTACPLFSAENDRVVQEYYSRNAEDMLRDIIWPALVTISARKKVTYTCFMGTKMNYDDPAQPSESRFMFYLQQMKEIGAEAGKSLDYMGTVTPEEKWKVDKSFYNTVGSNYRFRVWFAKQFSQLPKEPENLGKGTVSLVVRETGDLPIFGYYDNIMTYQGVTEAAEQYSYREDLKMRSLVTAYGYMNTLISVEKAFWPEKERDRWELFYDDVISNVFTYWMHYGFLTSTVASESDYRIRKYLNLDYGQKLEESTITLSVSESEVDAWFILRTHGRVIREAKNAEFEQIEANAFLIHAMGETMQFTLSDAEDLLEYKGPFSKK